MRGFRMAATNWSSGLDVTPLANRVNCSQLFSFLFVFRAHE